MSQNNKIISIQKQNDAIYSGLKAKGIEFERDTIPEGADDNTIIEILSNENNKLKELAKQNKPPPQVKEPKAPQPQQAPKPKKEEKEESDDEEEYEAPKPKFDCITNMEDIKRAFFNKDYENAKSLIITQPFKFYSVNYKFDSDKDGVPDFVAKNLLKGFVRNFDDYRKYFMICFRCWKAGSNYQYKSQWIVNTNEPIQNIIGSTYDDFEFIEYQGDIHEFVNTMGKLDENTDGLVGEAYVH
jgi:hypothetical protein